ncbi:MAG: leucyl/phenylalanyl-tRNA--protein transferase [Xanthobacteraceae bacterium]
MGIEPDHRRLEHVHCAAVARRDELFRETPLDTLTRWALGTAWALKPGRIGGLPGVVRMCMANLIAPARELPDPASALARPDGLCGIVHDLSIPTLVEAHRRGLYPFAHIHPLKWWSPATRCVLRFENFHIPKRLRSRLRQNRYQVTFDRDFVAVIKACAGRRDGKWPLTWITPKIMRAYCDLHDAGYAHSFEVWNADGALVGGGYGVAVGSAFTIESQFTLESHTSKIGFAMLNWHLAKWGFAINDNKGPTANTMHMGFEMVPRPVFQTWLAQARRMPDRRGRWETETDLQAIAEWHPAESAATASEPSMHRSRIVGARVGALLVPVVGAIGGERLALAEAVCAMI